MRRDVFLIRHAPIDWSGAAPGPQEAPHAQPTDGPIARLAGRSNPPAALSAALPDAATLERARRLLPDLAGAPPLTSPALRCVQTCAALWPDQQPLPCPALWEQDFGAWEGRPLASLPDLGPLSREELARARPHGGESFAQAAARIQAGILGLLAAPLPPGRPGGASAAPPLVLVAHAGTVRAALGLALGASAQGLAFEIAPLSLTHLRALGQGQWSIACVNQALA